MLFPPSPKMSSCKTYRKVLQLPIVAIINYHQILVPSKAKQIRYLAILEVRCSMTLIPQVKIDALAGQHAFFGL